MYYKVTPVLYKTKSMQKSRIGLYIYRNKTNTFSILDKDMEKVKGPFESICTLEPSKGCIYFNLK